MRAQDEVGRDSAAVGGGTVPGGLGGLAGRQRGARTGDHDVRPGRHRGAPHWPDLPRVAGVRRVAGGALRAHRRLGAHVRRPGPGPTPSDDGPAGVHRGGARGPGRRAGPPWLEAMRRRRRRRTASPDGGRAGRAALRPDRPARRLAGGGDPAPVAAAVRWRPGSRRPSCCSPTEGRWGGSGKWLVRELEAYDDATGSAYTGGCTRGWWRRSGARWTRWSRWPRRSWRARGPAVVGLPGRGRRRGRAGVTQAVPPIRRVRPSAVRRTCPLSSPMRLPASASLS